MDTRAVAMDNQGTMRALIRAREAGLSLRACAARAGIHVATVCRWQARDPAFRARLAAAYQEAQKRRHVDMARPGVSWHRRCPRCQARVVVRKARGGVPFWRCGCWPWCPWASWRPRHPRNCARCGGPRYWSHSRKSIVCTSCGVRTPAP
jgi:hypothetical protein